MKVPTLFIAGISIISLIALCESYCPIKYRVFPNHTACVSRSPNYISGGVTDAQKKMIIDLHNKHRAAVNPPACMMLKMYWDDELAFLAQKWAENCNYNHEKNLRRYIPGSYFVGQNLGSGDQSWTVFVNEWHAEVKDFTYGGSTNILHEVGHYTAVVWATSTLVGCGYAKCTNVYLYVCDYGPGGNNGKLNRPYVKCDTASPLKDCKGKVCKNGGSFKKDSCECSCKNTPQIYGPVCDINCTIKDRPMVCGPAFKPTDCKFTNVPYECPWMCKVCPFFNQEDKPSTVPQNNETESTTRTDKPTFPHSGSSKNSATYHLMLTVLFLILMM